MRRATCASSSRTCLTMKGTHRCHKPTIDAAIVNRFRRACFDCDYFAHENSHSLKFLFAGQREFHSARPILVSFRKDRDQEPLLLIALNRPTSSGGDPVNLVVVSKRGARGKANEPMTGGLAAALLPMVENSGAIWVGSSGRVRDGNQDPFAEIESL